MTYKGVKRSSKLQVMVTPSLRRRCEAEAGRLGLSLSSFLELVVGQHIANKGSQNLVNDEVV